MYIILGVLAAFFKSIGSITEKEVLKDESAEIYSSELAFIMAFGSLPMLFLVKDFGMSINVLILIYLTSILAFISSVTAAVVMKRLDVSETSVLFALSPIFVAILAVIFLNESLSALQLFGIALACIGLFILERHKATVHTLDSSHHDIATAGTIRIKWQAKKPIVTVIFLISIICFSIVVVIEKHIVGNLSIDSIYYLLIVQFFMLLNFIILDIFFIKKSKRKIFNSRLFLRLPFWGNVIALLAHRVAYMFALRGLEISILTMVKQLAAVFTTIIGGKLFKEKHMVRKTLACILVVGGMVLVILK